MGQVIREMSDEFGRISESRPAEFGLQNSLAAYVRRRWPQNTVKSVQVEWSMSEGEARGVVYATASLKSLNNAIKHKRGGWSLALWLVAHLLQCSLEEHLEQERRRNERRASRMAGLIGGLRACGDGLGADGARMAAEPAVGTDR